MKNWETIHELLGALLAIPLSPIIVLFVFIKVAIEFIIGGVKELIRRNDEYEQL